MRNFAALWLRATCGAWLVLLLSSLTVLSGDHLKLPPLAKIKGDAERGDPIAQDRLGDAYLGRMDPYNAVQWYRKAAEVGIVNSQYQLGKILINGNRMLSKQPVKANGREGIKWLLRAANQGHTQAQLMVAHRYRDGKTVSKDIVEAYKWYALAARQHSIVARVELDGLILKMAQDQIAEGQERVAGFRVSRHKAAPLQDLIELNGIGGFGNRRQAIINRQPFEIGEEKRIQLDHGWVVVRCVEIRENSVLVKIDEADDTTELRLPAR
jgi:hypothetical protein